MAWGAGAVEDGVAGATAEPSAAGLEPDSEGLR